MKLFVKCLHRCFSFNSLVKQLHVIMVHSTAENVSFVYQAIVKPYQSPWRCRYNELYKWLNGNISAVLFETFCVLNRAAHINTLSYTLCTSLKAVSYQLCLLFVS